jgi:ATP-dependent Clp protease, protease subunit
MTNGISPQPLQVPKQIYGFFVGPIDQHAVQRIANGISIAVNSGVEDMHMVFQSTGGNVGDGICIHNLFESVPLNIHLYNIGTVASIAVIAYLGADERYSTENASFMIHRTHFSPIAATSAGLQMAADTAILDDRRIETILREQITLPQEKWDVHKVTDLWLPAEEALEAGLATKIRDFDAPKGAQLFNLGPT